MAKNERPPIGLDLICLQCSGALTLIAAMRSQEGNRQAVKIFVECRECGTTETIPVYPGSVT